MNMVENLSFFVVCIVISCMVFWLVCVWLLLVFSDVCDRKLVSGVIVLGFCVGLVGEVGLSMLIVGLFVVVLSLGVVIVFVCSGIEWVGVFSL